MNRFLVRDGSEPQNREVTLHEEDSGRVALCIGYIGHTPCRVLTIIPNRGIRFDENVDTAIVGMPVDSIRYKVMIID